MSIPFRFSISLLVALFCAAWIHHTRPPTPDPRLRSDWFWSHKTHASDDATLVIYGDSRVVQAVDTRPIRERFPGHVPLNFGFNGVGFNPEMYRHLRAMAEGKEGRMVFVLGITPYSLSEEANANEHFLQEWNRPDGDVAERLRLYPWLSIFEPVAPSMYLAAEKGEGMFFEYHPDGWVEAYRTPPDPRLWIEPYKDHFRRTRVSEANVEATMRFVRARLDEDIPVYGFRPPTTREMEALENERSGFNEARFVERFEAAGGIWLRVPDRFAYFSYDGSHLHKHAAKKFSRDLAREMARTLR